MSPAARLCGFLILLALVFGVAYATGAHLGPVTTSYEQHPSGGGGSMPMGGTAP